MSKKLDEIINEVYNNYDDQSKEIDNIKSKIHKKSSDSDLKETIDRLVKADSNYIKRYMASDSRITYQKDFYIDNKEKFIYNSDFNNDSKPNRRGRVLLIIHDYTLKSDNYDFQLDVYVNGRMLDPRAYVVDPKVDNFNFITGSKRIFIEQEFIQSGDEISVVANKFPKFHKYYTTFIPTNKDDTQKTMYVRDIGEYHEDPDNLMVFKKSPLSPYFIPMKDDDEYCFIIEDDNKTYLNILEPITLGNTYLVMNKLKRLEVEYFIESELTLKEYLENPIMELDLTLDEEVDHAKIPFPIESAEEIECYIEGLKLIPNVDYLVERDVYNETFKIKFDGILRPGDRLILRNKNKSNVYGFYKHYDKFKPEEFVNLNSLGLPISNPYYEAYAGRRRISQKDRTAIADNIVLIENQECLTNLEIIGNIEYTKMTRELLNRYNHSKPTLTEISDIFLQEVTDSYKYNNDIRENSGKFNNIYTQDEIFYGTIDRIKLYADRTVLTQGHSPIFNVIGYINTAEMGDKAIDITDMCEISGFDAFKLGRQTVTAKYKFGDKTLVDKLAIEIVNKELLEIKIVLDSNYYVLGDKVRETVNVKAIYEDNSEKYIFLGKNENSEDNPNNPNVKVDAPYIATEKGMIPISAEYRYMNETWTTSKNIIVDEGSERIVEKIDVVLDTYMVESVEDKVQMQIIAHFNNMMVQNMDKEFLNVFEVRDFNTPDEKEYPIDIHDVKLELNKEHIIRIEMFNDIDKENPIKIREGEQYQRVKILTSTPESEDKIISVDGQVIKLYDGYTPEENYKYYRVREVDTDSYLTISTNKVEEQAMVFGVIEEGMLVIVEFYDDIEGIDGNKISEKLISQELFRVRTSESLKSVVEADLYGNVIDGYTTSIPRIALDKDIEDIDHTEIHIIDQNGNPSAYLDANADSVNFDDKFIRFSFKNFATSNGSVVAIDNIVDSGNSNCELKIPGIDKRVLLNFKTTENLHVYPEEIFLHMEEDELSIAVKPILPKNFKKGELYQARPLRTTLTEFTFEDNVIKFPINDHISKDILYNENQLGIHRYYITNNYNKKIYEIEFRIEHTGGRNRITMINEKPITDEEYNEIDFKK